MINFTVGPVQTSEDILRIGGEQVPYFRTQEFSELMLENESLMKEFVNAPDGSRTVFITGSGTAAMEAAVMNIFTDKDKLIVIDGGSFGHRFAELCEIHEIPYTPLTLDHGTTVTSEMLEQYRGQGYTGILVNIHETSTGVKYDTDILGKFAKDEGLIFVVDAISSFLADSFDMSECGANVVISGSQKVLACAPGISIIVLDKIALGRVERSRKKTMYLDLKSALKNGERGQTPFTPAVSILRQINYRMRDIKANGGVDREIAKVRRIAEDFRQKIAGLPFEIRSENMSNALTPLHPTTASAYDIFLELKDNYGIWVCPNGGELKSELFRVGHFGALTCEDNSVLISALKDMQKRGLI